MTSLWHVFALKHKGKERERHRERERSVSLLCEGIRLDYSYVRVGPVCVIFIKYSSNVVEHDEWQKGIYIPQHVMKCTLLTLQEGSKKLCPHPLVGD